VALYAAWYLLSLAMILTSPKTRDIDAKGVWSFMFMQLTILFLFVVFAALVNVSAKWLAGRRGTGGRTLCRNTL
jgi:hypothetical protein